MNMIKECFLYNETAVNGLIISLFSFILHTDLPIDMNKGNFLNDTTINGFMILCCDLTSF